MAALQLPPVERAALEIFSARGDEAGRWLRVWKLVTEAPMAVGCVLLSIVGGMVRFDLPIAVDHLGTSTDARGLDAVRAFGLDGWTALVGVLVLSLLWVAVLMVSSVVRRPGYWREPLMANVFVEIGTGTIPGAGAGDRHVAYLFDVRRRTVDGTAPRGLRPRPSARTHPSPSDCRIGFANAVNIGNTVFRTHG